MKSQALNFLDYSQSSYFTTPSFSLLLAVIISYSSIIFENNFIFLFLIFVLPGLLNKKFSQTVRIFTCALIFCMSATVAVSFASISNANGQIPASSEFCGLATKSDERSARFVNVKIDGQNYLEQVRLILSNEEIKKFEINELDYVCLEGKTKIFRNQFGISATIEDGEVISRFTFLASLKEKLEEFFISPIDKNLGENSRILKAIVLGVKDGLTDKDEDMFKQLGIMHLLVASGANIVLILALIDRIFSLIGRKINKKSVWLNISRLVIICSYLLIVGLEGSITRAFFFFIVSVIGIFFSRNISIFNKIMLSTVIMLLIFPGLVFSYSFLLSMVAVFALAFSSVVCEKIGLESDISVGLVTSLIVPLIMFIPTSYFFKEINLLSLISNLIITPAVEIFVLLGFSYVLFLAIFGNIQFLNTIIFILNTTINFIIESILFLNEVISNSFSLFNLDISYKIGIYEALILIILLVSIQIYFSYSIYKNKMQEIIAADKGKVR